MSFLGNQFRFGGQVNLTLSGSTRTLTIEEAFHRLIVFDSATEACTVTLPQIPGADWVIRNDTDYSLSIKNAVGSSFPLPSGAMAIFYCDGDLGLHAPHATPPTFGATTPGALYATTTIVNSIRLHSDISTPTDVHYQYPGVTDTSTDATQFTLDSVTVSSSNMGSGIIQFIGGCRVVASGACKLFDVKTAFKRVSNTVSVYGDVVNGMYEALGGVDVGELDAALSTASIIFDTSGTTLRVRATGVAATNLSWWGRKIITAATVT